MISVFISVCALALVAVTFVVNAWRMSALRDGAIHTDSQLSLLRSKIDTLTASMAASTPTALKVEVADLRGALDAMTASNRKEFGRLYARMPAAKREPVVFDENGDVDDEFQAMLRLQGATRAQSNGD